MGWKAIGFEQKNLDELPLAAMNPFRIIEEDGKIGVEHYFTLQRRIIIPAEYDYIEQVYVSEGIFFIVRVNKKYGVYNSEGKLIIEIRYDKIYIFETFISVRIGRYYGAYDFDGNHIVPNRYIGISSKYGVLEVVTLKKTVGIYDYQGNLIVPAEFVECKFLKFAEGKEEFIYVKASDECCGLYNKQGKLIVPMGHYILRVCDDFIVANGANPDVKATVYNYQGDRIMPESDYNYGKYNGKLILHGYVGHWQVYDKTGKEIEPGVIYEGIFASREFFAVKLNGQWKVLYST